MERTVSTKANESSGVMVLYQVQENIWEAAYFSQKSCDSKFGLMSRKKELENIVPI